MPDLLLKTNNTVYTGWKTISIVQSIDMAANSFDIGVKSNTSLAINEGDACYLQYSNQVALTGYIDDINDDYDATHWDQSITGRSKLADIIDCSTEGMEFKNQTVDAIARQLLSPFGIEVVVATDVGAALAKQNIAAGETIWAFLEKIARYRALLLYSDVFGRLVISRVGTQRSKTALVLGQNVRSARRGRSLKDRFSHYIVLGEGAGSSVLDTAASITGNKGIVIDTYVHARRYRPLVIIEDDPADNAVCTQRATWQRNTHFGRSRPITYVVSDWLMDDGMLWQPNMMVPVKDHRLSINQELLISEVNFIVDEQGKRCELTVQPKEAFELAELPEQLDSGLGGF
jgi:prophage tail gpP-like protein